MRSAELYALHLPAALAGRSTTLVKLLVSALGTSRSAAQQQVGPFELHDDERRFAEALLRRKPNLWLFRSNQQLFCGDFIVVDMSSPWPAARKVYILDLKQGAELRLGGGGAGVQFRNAPHALRQIAARTGIVPGDPACELLCGDRQRLLLFLGALTGLVL